MEVAESSSTLEDSIERKQTEDIYARQGPVSVVNADNGVRRFVANTLVNADNGVRRARRSSSRPIVIIDGWNKTSFKRFEEALRTGQTEHPVLGLRGKQMDRYKNRTILGGWEYREKYPDYIPVSVEKDPRSDIPDIDMKKYRVHSEMPLGELVYHIRLLNAQTDEKPWFAFFKNTQPPTGALMGQIDEENKDEDGFLRMTYSGEEDFDDTYVWVDKEDFLHEQQQ